MVHNTWVFFLPYGLQLITQNLNHKMSLTVFPPQFTGMELSAQM